MQIILRHVGCFFAYRFPTKSVLPILPLFFVEEVTLEEPEQDRCLTAVTAFPGADQAGVLYF